MFASRFTFGREIFAQEEDARARVNKLRVAKLASLRRQIEKLEKMEFVAE